MNIQSRPSPEPAALLPHQADLLQTFFSPSCGRVVLLQASVGLGKSSALVALATQYLRGRPDTRILILVPAAVVGEQYAALLSRIGVSVSNVDRYCFREMLESASGTNPWTQSSVFVVNQDLAKQPDILSSLLRAKWDLLIVDEAHRLRGARAVAIGRIGLASARVVLATAIPFVEPLPWLSVDETTVVEWRRNEIVHGSARGGLVGAQLKVTRFDRPQAERHLAATVTALCSTLRPALGRERLLSELLLYRLRSSPTALEGMLRRLCGRSTKIVLDETAEEESIDEVDVLGVDSQSMGATAELAVQALAELETLGTDSKLLALRSVLSQLGTSDRRVCVVTKYVATLYYLAAEAESLGMRPWLVHGGITSEDRQRVLDGFAQAGGILIVTSAMRIEEVTARDVTDLVLYDVTGASRARIESLIGGFDRLDRSTPLSVHVVVPSDDLDGSTIETLEALRAVLGGHSPSESGR